MHAGGCVCDYDVLGVSVLLLFVCFVFSFFFRYFILALSCSVCGTCVSAEPRDGGALGAKEDGSAGQEVRAHAQRHAVCHYPHDVVHLGELPNSYGGDGARGGIEHEAHGNRIILW